MEIVMEQGLVPTRQVQDEALSIFGLPVSDEELDRWLDWFEAFNAWLEEKRLSTRRGNTVRAYRNDWRQFFRWARIKPWAVTAQIVGQWVSFLSEHGKAVMDPINGIELRREPLSKSSINRKLAALASYYQFCEDRHRLETEEKRNPFKGVKRFKVRAYGRSVFPSWEEAKAILGRCNVRTPSGARDSALIQTFLVTCNRSDEILNLRWGDIEATETGYKFEFIYKGEDEPRAGYLDKATYEAIRHYLRMVDRLEEIGEEEYLFRAIQNTSHHLPNVDDHVVNRPLSNSYVNRMLKKYARRAGVEPAKAHIHGLRHAGGRYRYELMKKGVIPMDLLEIQRQLGHANINTTQIYLENTEAPTDEAAEYVALDLEKARQKSGRAKPAAAQQMSFEEMDLQAAEIEQLKAKIRRLEAALREDQVDGSGGIKTTTDILDAE